MNKHTAAPWHAVELEDGTVRICGNSKYAVAVCNTRNPFCPEQLANAKLIAAAPEILAALELAAVALKDAGFHQRTFLERAETILPIIKAIDKSK